MHIGSGLRKAKERDSLGRVSGKRKRDFVRQNFFRPWAHLGSTLGLDEAVMREYIKNQLGLWR